MIKLHRGKLLILFCLINLGLLLSLAIGDLKPFGAIDWFDIIGEGSVTAVVLAWIVFVLHSRPRGRVTNWLAAGLFFIFIGTFQDIVDEIVRMPGGNAFAQLESALTPLGLLALSFGLLHWYREQQTFNQRERKREQNYRNHRFQDPLTGLGDARFLQQQLALLTHEAQKECQPLALLLLDLDHFDHVNRAYGPREGDRLLRELSELLLLNLRRCDLLCRYAGDRFAIIMPNMGALLAREQARQLTQAVQHFGYKTAQGDALFHTVSAGLALSPLATQNELLPRATQALLKAKEAKRPSRAA